MSCLQGVFKDVISTCATQIGGGLEIMAYMYYRPDIESFTKDITNPSKITTFALKSGKRGYTFTGVKNLLNAQSNIVVSETRPNRYTHGFIGDIFELDAASHENITNADDIVVVVELKDKGVAGDGEFVILGLEQGLYKSADAWDANANNGVRQPQWTSPATGEKEERYLLDVGTRAATLAFLTGTLTPAT
jgi:hypothetical protein